MQLILFAVNQVMQKQCLCVLLVLQSILFLPPPCPPKAMFVNCVCRETMNKQMCLLNLGVDIVVLFVRNAVGARSFWWLFKLMKLSLSA